MKLFNRLTIDLRLWLNLLLALSFVGFVTLIGWLAANQTAFQANQLVQKEQQIGQRLSAFHKDFITTLQQSNNYVLTGSTEHGETFNQVIDQQIQSLETLMTELGANVEPDQSGYLELISEPQGVHSEIILALLPLDRVLRNLAKSTNSNVFMKARIGQTIEFGLDLNARSITRNLTALLPLIEDQPGLVVNIRELEKRLELSQMLAAKMIVSQDTQLKEVFDQTGFGFSAMPIINALVEPFKNDMFNGEAARNLDNSYTEYMESFGDLRDTITTMAQNNQSLADLSESGNLILLNLMSDLQNQSLESLLTLQTDSQSQETNLLIVGLIAGFVLLFLNFNISRSIVRPLKRMREQVLYVAQTGQFKQWQSLTGKNELADMSHALQALLQSVSQALNEIKTVSQSLAQGDTQQRMSIDYAGDLKNLSQAFNHSLDSVEATLSEISQASHALETGELSLNINLAGHSGQFLHVLNAMANALSVQKQAIDGVRHVTHAMREGNFSQRVENDMPGELQNLKRYLNESLERLENAINSKSDSLKAYSQGDFSHQHNHEFEGKLQELNTHMLNMAQSVSYMLQDVKHATDHAVHGIKEISVGNQDLNLRVQKQAAAVQNTSASMSLMFNSVRETLNEANQVSHTTDQVQQDSQSGLVIVEQMVLAMQDIQQASQQIAQITGLIDSIAFQTNLLALNAAVEAARAGEAGRGFAVVATEVRNLAQRSAEAAQQIRQVTDTNMQRIDHGMQLSQQTQSVFEQNTTSIEGIAKMILKMNKALELQSHGIKEVTEALSEIDESTQQNAALVEQISTTSSHIIEQVLGLETKVSGFKLVKPKAQQAA
ncbi:MAG: HAMP domain-containing protein [Methyloprofundus sp.]|nr:HAMP domain-containing protein [Methyloprofundus sp.]